MRAFLRICTHAVVRLLLRLLYGLHVRARIADDPCVIVANHNTHLDAFVLFSLVPLAQVARLRAVAAADYFGKGCLGWLARFLFHAVLVDRGAGGAHDDPLEPVAAAVAAGHSLVVFPEGSRGEPGRLGPFKTGIGELALRFPYLPIHPVALVGIERTMPRNHPLPIPFNITAILCPPLRPADLQLPVDHRLARRQIAAELQHRIEQALASAATS